MEEKKVKVPNITCGHCVATIKRELEELQGVKEVEGNPETKEVLIKWETPADWSRIAGTLSEIGYPPEE